MRQQFSGKSFDVQTSCMKIIDILEKCLADILLSLTELRYSFVSGKYRDRILFNVLVASDVPPQTP